MVFIMHRQYVVKAFLSLVISIVVSQVCLLSAFAAEIDINDRYIEISIHDAIEREALSWAKCVYKNEVEIKDITRIIAPDAYSFCVSFFENNTPCGYAVFMYSNGEFEVPEFSDVYGTKDIYTNIKQDIISQKSINDNIGEFMFKAGPMDYALGYINERGELRNEDCYGQDVSTPQYVIEAVCSTYKKEDSIFIKIDEFTNANKYKIIGSISYDVMGAKFDKNPKSSFAEKGDYKALWDTWYVNTVKKYNCGLTADLHILAIDNKLGDFSFDDISKAYKKLMNMATTKKEYKKDGNITYYSMYASDVNKVLLNYYKMNPPYKAIKSYYKKNPTSIWLKNEIKNSHPIVLSYHIETEKGKCDHAVTVFSYRTAKKISNGITYNYLGVFDGWSNIPKFINYSTTDFKEVTEAYSYKL